MGDLFPVVGGQAGWGGFVNRGDRFLASNEASDCLNVYEENGVLKKRKGYTKNSGAFVLGGAYEAASTGYISAGVSPFKYLTQEVLLSGAGSGGDTDFVPGTMDLIVAFSITGISTIYATTAIMDIYSLDGSGHPLTKLVSGQSNMYVHKAALSEKWIYFCYKNVTLSTDHVCFSLRFPSLGPSATCRVHYSTGGGGYAPGGAKIAAYSSDGSSWVDIPASFRFKFYYKSSVLNNRSFFQYNGTLNKQEYNSTASFLVGDQTISDITSILPDLNDLSVFAESESTGFLLMSFRDTTTGGCIFPLTQLSGIKNVRISNTRLIIGSENYLFQSSFNDWPLRIAKFTAANNVYRFANTPSGLMIAPDKNAPQVWGSTSYPISGYTGAAAFTGLTNPIALAAVVMYHGTRVWWGNVTINSVAYPSRCYYSGLALAEDGYTDTGYIVLDGAMTAAVDVGDYAILADAGNTYYFLGGNGPSTSMERLPHDVDGGVANQEALAVYRDAEGNCVVYGWGFKGIFKISQNQKQYINDKILEKLNSLIISDISLCPDYRRGLMLFSYTEAGVRKVLAYDVDADKWWIEDFSATQMIPIVFPTTAVPKIYGIKGAEWWDMYTGNEDDKAFIQAYWKGGPAYANGERQLTKQSIWLKTRNEPNVAHLDVKYSDDYATEVFDSTQHRRALRKTTFPDNVPVLRKVNVAGTCSSTEIKLFQDKISTTINVNSNSGQAVLSVADVTGFLAGHKIRINTGGAREETAVISAVGATSLTLTGNLTYSHTSAQADTVYTYDESFSVSELYIEGTKETQLLEQDI